MKKPFEIPPSPPWILDEHDAVLERLEGMTRPFDMLESLYRFLDLLYASMGLPEKTVCKAGCADCCRIEVSVTELEVQFIKEYLGTKKRAVKPSRRRRTREQVEGKYCPLLDKETLTCTVYEARPFYCRTFLVFDSPEFCWPPNQSHWMIGASGEGFGSDMLMGLAANILNVNFQVKGEGPRDIRDWFRR